MNTHEMNQLLTEEWNRIDAAINLLSGSNKIAKARHETRKSLSAAARKRISEAQQKRWAKEKQTA